MQPCRIEPAPLNVLAGYCHVSFPLECILPASADQPTYHVLHHDPIVALRSLLGPRFNGEQPAMGWFRDTLMCRIFLHVSLKPEGCIVNAQSGGPFQCDQDVHCIDAWAATGMCESKSVSPATPAKNSILKPFGNPRSGLRSVARTCQNPPMAEPYRIQNL